MVFSPDYLTRLRGFSARHHIRQSGTGRQTVVLANGFGTDHSIWRRLLPWLEERYRVVRFDWATDPGHYDATRYQHIESYAEDLLAVMTHAKARPSILICHSMGGMVGMLAERMLPGQFQRMVMLAPSPCYRNFPGYNGGLAEAEIRGLLEQVGEDYMNWADHFPPIAVGASASTDEIQEFTRSLKALRPDIALSMATTIWKIDLRDRLDGFTVPTDIILSTRDPAVPVDVAHYLARRWKQARLFLIDGAGHLPHLTHPEQVLAVLRTCLPAA